MQIDEILEFARSRNAADIHIFADAPIMLRIGRELIAATKEPLTDQQSRELSIAMLTDNQRLQLEEQKDLDFMASDHQGRYRVNVGYFDDSVGAVIRILPDKPNSCAELFLPEVVADCTRMTKGLILITGSTSQGKTTTLASMIDRINTHQRRHVVTIEDPIEYLHTNKKSIVRQRAVGRDTESFYTGLRAALRQDPDVIAIGEMRDYETIKIALTAAETGVLVMSTIHIISIDKMIERLLSYGPPQEEMHLRYLLADCLQAVIHQELMPTVSGGKRVACEILVATDAARNVIRRRGTFLLRNIITSGKKYNMVTMSESVGNLLEEGLITEDAANSVLVNYQK